MSKILVGLETISQVPGSVPWVEFVVNYVPSFGEKSQLRQGEVKLPCDNLLLIFLSVITKSINIFYVMRGKRAMWSFRFYISRDFPLSTSVLYYFQSKYKKQTGYSQVYFSVDFKAVVLVLN